MNIGKILYDCGRILGNNAPIDGLICNNGPIVTSSVACQITNLGAGDVPFKWCQGSFVEGNFGTGDRRLYTQCLADYEPNLYKEFIIRAEPSKSYSHDGYNYSSGVSDYTYASEMHGWAMFIKKSHVFDEYEERAPYTMWSWGVLGVSPHCERLSFISNFSSNYDGDSNPEERVGWFRPGGSASSEPPIPQGEIIYGRAATANFNPMMIAGQSGELYSMVVQDFGDKDQYASTYVSGKGHSLPPSSDTNLEICEPNFNDPYAYAEKWAGWCPSMLGKSKDQNVSLTQTVSVEDYDLVAYYNDEEGHYEVPVKTYSKIHQYIPGHYDWRFLNTLISRVSGDMGRPPVFEEREEIGCTSTQGQTKHHSVRWFPMYWDIKNNLDLPTGPDWDDVDSCMGLRSFIMSVADLYLPKFTKFDIKIQAAIYSFRCGSNIPSALEELGYYPKILNTETDEGVTKYRVWDHTVYKIQIRQSMPIADHD